jgi:hypothetical protein
LSKFEKRNYFFISLILFCKLFTFNLDFPSLRFPLATLVFWVVAISQFFTLFYSVIYSGIFIVVVPRVKKNLSQINFVLNRCSTFWQSHCCEDVFFSVGGVTREIVQPAKASNFSENRLLKRASPHDTETIYQLFFSLQ